MFDELGHGPIEKNVPGFGVVAETVLQFFTRRRFADPEILVVRWADGVA